MILQPIIDPGVVAALAGIMVCIRLYSLVNRRGTAGARFFAAVRCLLIAALVVVICLRPVIEETQMDVEVKNVDVLFAIDGTISMWAEDYSGSSERMSGVISDCQAIMDELKGAAFGVVKFDNLSWILAPYTQDTEAVTDVITMISRPDPDYAAGSSLNTPYNDIKRMLESSRKKDDRMTVVFFMSDGEITDDSQLRSFAELSKYVDQGAVLGYGTAEGGPMKKDDYKYIYLGDTYEKALSVIDEDALRQIASDLGIRYIHMDGEYSKEELSKVASQIIEGSRSATEKKDVVSYRDIYFWFVIPLFLLLAAELYLLLHRDRL